MRRMVLDAATTSGGLLTIYLATFKLFHSFSEFIYYYKSIIIKKWGKFTHEE